MDGLGDDRYAVLNGAAEQDLSGRFAVFFRKRLHNGLGKHFVRPALPQRRVSHMRHAVFLFPGVLRLTLAVQVRFDLVDSGHYPVIGDQIDQPVRLEVGHANGANLPFVAHLFQLSPRGIAISKGPMQQHQIQIIRAQLLQGIFHRRAGMGIGFEVDLRDGEKPASVNAAGFDSIANLLFVTIGLGCIDQAIARANRFGHRAFAIVARIQKGAEPQQGHGYALRNFLIKHFAFLHLCLICTAIRCYNHSNRFV